MNLFDDIEKRTVLRRVRALECSLVDEPAQGPALIKLRKRGASGHNRVLVVKALPSYLPHQRMTKGLVHGIAAVSTVNGEPFFDSQGDFIPVDELHSIAKQLLKGGDAGVMHMRDGNGDLVKAGKIVEALVLDNAMQKRLGVNLGMEPLIIGVKVEHPVVLKMAEDGVFSGFSLGGMGQRVPVEKRIMARIDKQARVVKARDITAQLIEKARRQLDEMAAVVAKCEGVSFPTAWARVAKRNPELYDALKALGGFAISVGDSVAKAAKDYTDGKSGGISASESDRVGLQEDGAVFDPDNARSYSPEDMADYYAADDITHLAGDQIYYNTDADNETNVAKAKLDAAAEKIRDREGCTPQQAFAKACAENNEIYKAWRAAGGGMARVGKK
jgi:Putative phage serine protease XkdF